MKNESTLSNQQLSELFDKHVGDPTEDLPWVKADFFNFARAALQASPVVPAEPGSAENSAPGQEAPHWQPVPPRACVKPTREAADAFWKYWRENGETHKHGYYESTWGAINAALAFGWAEGSKVPVLADAPASARPGGLAGGPADVRMQAMQEGAVALGAEQEAPLTDEQIDKLVTEYFGLYYGNGEELDMKGFARAIERAAPASAPRPLTEPSIAEPVNDAGAHIVQCPRCLDVVHFRLASPAQGDQRARFQKWWNREWKRGQLGSTANATWAAWQEALAAPRPLVSEPPAEAWKVTGGKVFASAVFLTREGALASMERRNRNNDACHAVPLYAASLSPAQSIPDRPGESEGDPAGRLAGPSSSGGHSDAGAIAPSTVRTPADYDREIDAALTKQDREREA